PFDFTFVNMLTFEWSDRNLLASDQLGFGGYTTLRGFDTRVYNADHGYIISSELRTPPASLLGLSGWQKAKTFAAMAGGDRFQFLGFVDFGAGGNRRRLPGEPVETKLLSAGPGLRYAVGPYLAVRADYGWQVINQAQTNRKFTARSHLGVTLSF